MSNQALLDTNMLCRHALQDHDDHSPRVNALFQRVLQAEENVYCPVTAIFEAIYVIHIRNGAPRDSVAEYFQTIAGYPGLELEHHNAVMRALRRWLQSPKLDFADCFHLALAKENRLDRIYSFDRRMSGYPGVERIEPE